MKDSVFRWCVVALLAIACLLLLWNGILLKQIDRSTAYIPEIRSR